MIKRLLPFCAFLALFMISFNSSAQLNINNATFAIQTGATVTVQGNLTSNVNITGSGKILMKGSSLQNVNMNGTSLPNLEIDNASNVSLTGNTTVANQLLFTNGKLLLGNNNLTIETAGTIAGGTSNKFIVTNGTGYIKKNNIGSIGFFFPAGFSATEYNPLTLSNLGAPDNFTLRTTQNVLINGVTPATTGFANNSWIIGEDVVGGSNLTMIADWNAADELSGFNRTKTGIARYTAGSDWDLPASNVLAASGTGPYERTRAGINSTGTFAVADLQQVNRATVNLKAFLQGAYTGTGGGIAAGLMRDQLRANGVLPTTQPYAGGKFVQTGVQGGSETVASTVFNPAASTNNNIVDWVFVTLLDAASPATKLQTRAAFIQRDGDIVDLDGVSPLSFPINTNGNYHISVGHRNHLSVRTPNASPLNLVENGPAATWDFTTGTDKAYNDPLITSNTALVSVSFSGNTKFSLRGGNTDGMTNAGANGKTVIYSGAGNDKSTILSTALAANPSGSLAITAANYLTRGMFDLNLNGTIVYSGSGNDPIIILNALGGNTSITAKEHQ
jgi:hypothetical protein